MYMKKVLFGLLMFVSVQGYAMDDEYGNITVPDIQLKDTVFMGYTLEPTEVYAIVPPKNLGLTERDKIYLRKVYPYALRIAHLTEQIDRELASLNKNRKKKNYIKEMKAMLKNRFTADVKDLTRIQGQMLTKLVYRETGETAYDLIKGYRGGFVAGWWNMLGKLYAQDLKMEYNPDGEDCEMERYVRYLDQIYNRDGVKEDIQKEEFLTPSQMKKKKQ